MLQKQKDSFSESWFYKWILNNQAVIGLMITFLIFLTLYLFTKISSLFTPTLFFDGFDVATSYFNLAVLFNKTIS